MVAAEVPPWAAAMVRQMQELPRQMRAISYNSYIRRKNSKPRIAERCLFPLAKELQGAGDDLVRAVRPPRRVAVADIPPPLTVIPAIGSRPRLRSNRPRGYFPDDLVYLTTQMTDIEILKLIQFYNDTFGITVRDSLQVRRTKFKKFICFAF